MPKDVPVCPSKPTPARRGMVERRLTIKLITPMFGGGVEAGVCDPHFPIRPTAIRGQLQFWWRATAGARCKTIGELRAEQSKVWGSTEQASPTRVMVKRGHASRPEPCAVIQWDSTARQGNGGWRTQWLPPLNQSNLPYALFPFQGETPPPNPRADVKKPPAVCIREAVFEVIIECSDQVWSQVEPAVWAWVNFGGLGARTRRGCGAIWCEEYSPRNAPDLADKLKQYAFLDSSVREWPTLAATVLARTTESPGDPAEVWGWLIGVYKCFRQGSEFARNPGRDNNRPGRSRYPEPEAIRKLTNRRSSAHQPLQDIPNDAFPRAELGLPIVFHFKDGGDPPDTVLYPSPDASGKSRDRMASPLILKPLALADGKAIPLIARMRTPLLDGVELREGDNALALPESTAIRGPRLADYRKSPLAGLSPNGSALEAFLNFARKEGFKEVVS